MLWSVLLGSIPWLALGAFGWPREASRPGAPKWAPALLVALIFAQVLFGAILAGADGGKAFADWPTIGGHVWPRGAFEGALTENHATQHLLHRTLGYVVALVSLLLAALGLRGDGAARGAALAVGLAALGQAGLGVATVMHAAPLGLSLAHQGGAILLWIAAITACRITVK